MKKQIAQLIEFHKSFDSYYRNDPSTDVPEEIKKVRVKLMKEELAEVIESIEDGQTIDELAKELADLLYVHLGTVLAYGLQDKFEEIFTAVHESNMSKLGDDGKPIHREDGKVLKSKNYKKPDIEKILN
jgi:predicted HAD superfamily Cof-like phosphohydrolase